MSAFNWRSNVTIGMLYKRCNEETLTKFETTQLERSLLGDEAIRKYMPAIAYELDSGRVVKWRDARIKDLMLIPQGRVTGADAAQMRAQVLQQPSPTNNKYKHLQSALRYSEQLFDRHLTDANVIVCSPRVVKAAELARQLVVYNRAAVTRA